MDTEQKYTAAIRDLDLGVFPSLRAAATAYGPTKAQSFARPVCDTSYATGVASMG